jgi:hypothetical protein
MIIQVDNVSQQAYIGAVSPRTRTSLFLDDAQKAGLKALKQRDGIPEAEAIRRAVTEYLEKRGVAVEVKTAFRRAGTRRKA